MSNLKVPFQHRGLDIYPDDDDSSTFEITVRFSASLPDQQISVPANDGPNTATLKQRIRASLPDDLKNKRIRLIHAGKALDDAIPLSTSLKRLTSKPPSRISTPGPESGRNGDSETAKGKGKQPVRDTSVSRVYIHCSIGDVKLSAEDLAAEEKLASARQTLEEEEEELPTSKQNGPATTTTPAPRGFDRLLSAGFTPAEILSLRQQFLSIQAHTHTPDTLPSPTTLRALEDQWLDNSNAASTTLDASDAAAAGSMASLDPDDSGRGALDDMIWGTTLGFFWPIGCLIWGVREEGIFSPRRKIAIVIGIFLNFGLGFVRWGG